MSTRRESDHSLDLASKDVAARLRGFPAFSKLSATGLTALARLATLLAFESGDRILVEGEPANNFYVVFSGRVKMLRSLANGRNVVLGLFEPGELFGTVAALGAQACDTSIVAMGRTSCLKLSRDDFITLCEQRPQLISELLPLLAQRLVECGNCIVEMTCYRAETRFARLLLKLADSVGRPLDGGTLIPVPLSRQELADMAGTTIETCIRVMSRWRKIGMVDTERGGFLIRDRALLTELGNP